MVATSKCIAMANKIATTGYLSGSQMPNLSRFTIGNESADMSGQIDEFRVWEKALPVSTLRKYANVPLEGELLDKAKSEDKLILYYNFNQNFWQRSGPIWQRL